MGANESEFSYERDVEADDETVKSKLNAPNAIVIDARPESSFSKHHAKGAQNIAAGRPGLRKKADAAVAKVCACIGGW